MTGGVLRGDKARFQLFGDTVNTASRMESTGIRNRIHISEDSANLISAFGKTHWVKLREDKVKAKGKGIMNTYWLNPTARRANSVISSGGEQRTTITYRDLVSTNARHERLVNWVRIEKCFVSMLRKLYLIFVVLFYIDISKHLYRYVNLF